VLQRNAQAEQQRQTRRGWSIDGRLAFSWIERDGPPVREPTRRGFGNRLIQDILAMDSGWSVTLDYAPAGLRCTMLIME